MAYGFEHAVPMFLVLFGLNSHRWLKRRRGGSMLKWYRSRSSRPLLSRSLWLRTRSEREIPSRLRPLQAAWLSSMPRFPARFSAGVTQPSAS